MEELARQVWDPWRELGFGATLAPHTDIYEEKGQLVMKTELPGIGKEDLEVTLEGDRLTIKAERGEEVAEDATHYTRERYYGKYFRSMTLPFPVKGDKILATFDNGVLELRLPKAEAVKAQKIEIRAQLPQGEPKRRQRKSK
jgi:HSP20 family protein